MTGKLYQNCLTPFLQSKIQRSQNAVTIILQNTPKEKKKETLEEERFLILFLRDKLAGQHHVWKTLRE